MIPSYNKTLEGKYGIVKRPSFNGVDKDIINGLAFSVSANTKHPEEARTKKQRKISLSGLEAKKLRKSKENQVQLSLLEMTARNYS